MRWWVPAVAIIVFILIGSVIFLKPFSVSRERPPVQSPSPGSESVGSQATGIRVEEYVSGLQVPWSLVFTSPDRLLVSQRQGTIREIVGGRLREEPILTIPGVIATGETGLMGMALDPSYLDNHWIYACFTTGSGRSLENRVIRMIDRGDRMEIDIPILSGLPAAQVHAGCRIRFGPDGAMYVTLGDATDGSRAQDTGALNGKILRLNADGSVPQDNPFPGSLVYAYGFRNPQGLMWDGQGRLWVTDHGPSGFDGPPGGDEINLVLPGRNYGWPLVSHERTAPDTVAPEQLYTPAIAPADMLFIRSDVLPELRNTMLVSALRGEGIFKVTTDTDGTDITGSERLNEIDVGRVRAMALGPDGYVYFGTSNTDGRGKARTGDDRIYRIVPATD